MDTATVLAVTQTITGVAAFGLTLALARADRRRRAAEDQLHREREQREDERRDAAERRATLTARPVIVVEHAGASNDGGSLDRRLVKVRVSNKGPTTAHRVEVGIRLAGDEMAAGPGGTPNVLPALAPTDAPLVLVVQVDSHTWRSMPLYEVDNAALWARWQDSEGNEYSAEVPSP